MHHFANRNHQRTFALYPFYWYKSKHHLQSHEFFSQSILYQLNETHYTGTIGFWQYTTKVLHPCGQVLFHRKFFHNGWCIQAFRQFQVLF